MSTEKKYLRCNVCGNLADLINDSKVKMICCGQPMKLLKANTTDAAAEKHVPVASREKNIVTVKVGEIAHPMLKEHYIQWISIFDGVRTQHVTLSPETEPCAKFLVADSSSITVYEYCNLHGLWKTVLE